MAAVDQHSKFREDPWGRLERTTSFVIDDDLRRHRGRRGGGGACAQRCTRASTASTRSPARRTRGAIPISCCGSTRSRSSRSCSRTARTPAACPRRRRPVRRRDGPGRRDGRAAPGRWCRGQRARSASTCVRCAGLRGHAGRASTGCASILFPPMHLAYRPLWAIPTTAAVAILPEYRAPDVPHPVVPPARAAGARRGVHAQPGAERGDADAAGGAGGTRARARCRRSLT